MSSSTPSKHPSSSSSSKKDKGDKDKKKTKSVSFMDALACAVYPDLMGPKLRAAHRGSKSHKSKSSSKSSSSKPSSSKSAGGDDDAKDGDDGDKDSGDDGDKEPAVAAGDGDQVSYISARVAARADDVGSNFSQRSGGRYGGTTLRHSAPYLEDAGSRVTSFFDSHPQTPPTPRSHYSSHHTRNSSHHTRNSSHHTRGSSHHARNSHHTLIPVHEDVPVPADPHSQDFYFSEADEEEEQEEVQVDPGSAFLRREHAAYTTHEPALLTTAEQWHTRMAAWTAAQHRADPPPPAPPSGYHTDVSSVVAPSDSISVAHLRRQRRGESVVAPSDSISVAESRRRGRSSRASRRSRE